MSRPLRWTLILSATLALLMAGCQSDKERARELLSQASEILPQQAEEAARMATEASQLDPELHAALGLLAKAKLRSGDAASAQTIAQDAIAKSPEGGYYVTLGSAELVLERWQPAVAAFDAALEKGVRAGKVSGPLAEALTGLGSERAGTEDWAGASEAFKRSLQLDGSQLGLHFVIGDALDHLEQHDEAIASYERAIEAEVQPFEARLRVAERLFDVEPLDTSRIRRLLSGAEPHAQTDEERARLAAARARLDGDTVGEEDEPTEEEALVAVENADPAAPQLRLDSDARRAILGTFKDPTSTLAPGGLDLRNRALVTPRLRLNSSAIRALQQNKLRQVTATPE